MRESILLFGGDDALALRLRKTLAPLRVMVRPIPAQRFHCSVGYLAGDKSCPGNEELCPCAPLEQPLLLLAGFAGARMDQVLTVLVRGGVPVDYKAVLTPTNRQWDVPTLYRQIAQEHAQTHPAGN
jgi:hypothetical protein